MNKFAPFISLIVARCQNGVIGRDNAMPWHLPSDLRRFKKLTLGKPIIMGRKTYSSIGRPLPQRTNIIISKTSNCSSPLPDVEWVNCVSQAQERAFIRAKQDGIDEVFVIGGAEIFKLFIEKAARLYITEIMACLEGDTFFPSFEVREWYVTRQEKQEKTEEDSHHTRFMIYERRKM